MHENVKGHLYNIEIREKIWSKIKIKAFSWLAGELNKMSGHGTFLKYTAHYNYKKKEAGQGNLSWDTVTHKIIYTVVNVFFLGLSCSGKKREKMWQNLFDLNKQVNIRKSTLLK